MLALRVVTLVTVTPRVLVVLSGSMAIHLWLVFMVINYKLYYCCYSVSTPLVTRHSRLLPLTCVVCVITNIFMKYLYTRSLTKFTCTHEALINVFIAECYRSDKLLHQICTETT